MFEAVYARVAWLVVEREGRRRLRIGDWEIMERVLMEYWKKGPRKACMLFDDGVLRPPIEVDRVRLCEQGSAKRAIAIVIAAIRHGDPSVTVSFEHDELEQLVAMFMQALCSEYTQIV